MMSAAKNSASGVTMQQERFAAEFVKSGRAAVAYRRAYDAENMQPESVWVEASRLLDNPKVALRVEHYRKIAVGRLEASVERIAIELARIAFFDPRDLFDEDGQPVPISELPEDAARVIAGLDVEDLFERDEEGNRLKNGVVKKYKLSNKLTALETLAKWRKMLVDRVETGKPGEFEHLDTPALEKYIREQSVKLGLAKIVPLKAA